MNRFLQNKSKGAGIIEEALLGRVYNEPIGNYDGYEDYKKIYNILTPKEKEVSLQHPKMVFKVFDNMHKAYDRTMFLDGNVNGYGDAIRHCYWSALNQMAAGLNSPIAKKFGDAHEEFPENIPKEKAMDLYNNAVGYYLGNQAIINGWSEDELFNYILKAANNGKLQLDL